MNLDIKIVGISYSISKSFVSLVLSVQLVDLDQLDENGNPKVLDEKTITVQQNMLSATALDELKAKVKAELKIYLEHAKTNTEMLVNTFGTADPETILDNVKNDIETNIIPTVKTEVLGA